LLICRSTAKVAAKQVVYGIETTPECPNGTRGRTGVFELIPMDRELENVILTKPVEEEILAVARKKGVLTMREDALMKAFDRIIPFEEVNTLGGDTITTDGEADAEPLATV
jgi:type II secretory ATPase GspE/PulE/Tfp pilus assembly ATPase PilB-like protein